MAFLHDSGNAFKALWLMVKSAFVEKVEASKGRKSDRSTTIFVLILVGCGLVYGGYKGYHWFGARREAQAQKTFADLLQLVEQAQQNPKKWADVAAACAAGYEQNSSSKLAPIFLMYRADAFAAQGDTKQAITVMQDGIARMSSTYPLRSLYAVKLALMKSDATDPATRDAGLKELSQLAEQNIAGSDTAAYYLGLHFWRSGDVAKAQNAWKRLAGTSTQENASPYAAMVEEKLKQTE
jgi:predicted negative regulator of RcsB-dependent stress response